MIRNTIAEKLKRQSNDDFKGPKADRQLTAVRN